MREPASAFSPLPLRARSVLELLDTSLKVYKQYFWVLLGWSALVNILGLLASTVCSGFGQMLFTPVFLGVAACCVAAAVRGQNVTFGQCWQFAQARFGGMLGWFLLTMLITFVVLGVLCGLFIGLFALLAGIMFGGNSTTDGVLITVYVVVASLVISLVGIGLFTWSHMAPLVECMEENNREKKVLPRSWALMQGQWMRATSLMTILSLAALVLLIIIWSAGALIMGLDAVRQAFEGSFSPSLLLIIGIMISSYGLVFTLFTPAFLIAIVLFYLDIRVRKDALDLEWTTHATAPSVPASPPTYAVSAQPGTPYGVSGFENLTPAQQTITPPVAPVASEPVTNVNANAAADVFEVPVFESFTSPVESTGEAPLSTASASPAASEAVASWQSLIEEAPPAPITPSADSTNVSEVVCPACGKHSPANYLFCMSCGAQLPGRAR